VNKALTTLIFSDNTGTLTTLHVEHIVTGDAGAMAADRHRRDAALASAIKEALKLELDKTVRAFNRWRQPLGCAICMGAVAWVLALPSTAR